MKVFNPSSSVHTFFTLLLCVSAVFVSSTIDGRFPRIINGKPSSSNNHPFFASFLKWNPETKQQIRFCGGSVVGLKWVLTAAHCVEPNLEDMKVAVGHIDRNQSNFIATRSVKNSFLPDGCRGSNELKCDVALLEMNEPFRHYVQLMNLARKKIKIGIEATAIGYGRTERGMYPNVLLEAHSKVRHCPHGYDDGVVCFGDDDGNMCHADSGAPLFTEDNEGYSW
uniref:Peptidase S1 domain-containing protein n=1 Tax=Steinernema glaseri TaxID=37863 RepID=A0A1I7YS77_9BILA